MQQQYRQVTKLQHLILQLTCLYITLTPLFLPSQITHTHTLFDKKSLGVDVILCHAQDAVWQFKLLHATQSRNKKGGFRNIFSCVLVLSNSICTNKRQSVQLWSHHTQGGSKKTSQNIMACRHNASLRGHNNQLSHNRSVNVTITAFFVYLFGGAHL